jgi:hypothetical protein
MHFVKTPCKFAEGKAETTVVFEPHSKPAIGSFGRLGGISVPEGNVCSHYWLNGLTTRRGEINKPFLGFKIIPHL